MQILVLRLQNGQMGVGFMQGNSIYGKKEHKARLLDEARKSLSGRVYKPLPLDNIKVGQVVFLKEQIAEGPNEYSPGGVYGQRGDAVVVLTIGCYRDMAATKSDDYCTVKYRYSVKHCDYEEEGGFVVDRWEVMPTDPLVTVQEQRNYINHRGRYKTLESRFGKYKEQYNVDCNL